MNQLLTEMDGVTAQKMVFFIGATNRPDILDPAMMRPGRLDSLIYIGLPDFEARISIFKAVLRKSPIDPEVDFEFFADRTEGFSGADIASICKAAAKNAIRGAITAERKKFEAKEAKRKAAEEAGTEYNSDEDEKDDDAVPFITKKMLMSALSNSRRSVSPADLEKYMRYKRDMERRLGMDDIESSDAGGDRMRDEVVIGLNPERRPGAPAPDAAAAAAAAATSAPTRAFTEEAEEDDDDIYD